MGWDVLVDYVNLIGLAVLRELIKHNFGVSEWVTEV